MERVALLGKSLVEEIERTNVWWLSWLRWCWIRGFVALNLLRTQAIFRGFFDPRFLWFLWFAPSAWQIIPVSSSYALRLAGKMQLQSNPSMPMMGKTAGLQQQTGNSERKTLSNITNTMKSAGAPLKFSANLLDVEYSSSKSVQTTARKGLSARVPLRNITNENVVVNPSPGNPSAKEAMLVRKCNLYLLIISTCFSQDWSK